jgi:hypothetical protein
VSAICVKDSFIGEGLRPFDAVMGDMALGCCLGLGLGQ